MAEKERMLAPSPSRRGSPQRRCKAGEGGRGLRCSGRPPERTPSSGRGLLRFSSLRDTPLPEPIAGTDLQVRPSVPDLQVKGLLAGGVVQLDLHRLDSRCQIAGVDGPRYMRPCERQCREAGSEEPEDKGNSSPSRRGMFPRRERRRDLAARALRLDGTRTFLSAKMRSVAYGKVLVERSASALRSEASSARPLSDVGHASTGIRYRTGLEACRPARWRLSVCLAAVPCVRLSGPTGETRQRVCS